MDDKTFQSLLSLLKGNEALLHKVIFAPADAVKELGFLSAADREIIAKLTPESALEDILKDIGSAADCGVTVQCGSTCTHTSSLERMLDGREVMADCGDTVQCTQTCGHTSSVADSFKMESLASDIKSSIAKRNKG